GVNRTLLTRERARAEARRRADMLRTRARIVLSGRWNLCPEEIPAAIAELHPEIPEAEREALAREVRRVQREESPRRVPVGSVRVRPPELEGKDVYGTPADADRWRRIFADSLENRPQVRREREVEG
ncbi:MAG TPA: hypothetical protein VF167_01870, partial [Longimicrobiaceae bacterium]